MLIRLAIDYVLLMTSLLFKKTVNLSKLCYVTKWMCISQYIKVLNLMIFFYVNEIFESWSYKIVNTSIRCHRDYSLQLIFEKVW